MNKMCELAKALSDLKLTRQDVRKGLSGFEVLTISKRCKTTVNETYRSSFGKKHKFKIFKK